MPTNDMWIAALVLQHSLSLYDRDRHFDALPQLSGVWRWQLGLDGFLLYNL